jgi:hypothetical protein
VVDGDPQVRGAAAQRVVIRIERVALPAGLRAIAQRDTDGILVVYVSEGLDAQRQRAAVMAAVRATRRAGWRGAVPAGVAAFGSVRLLLRRVAARIHTQPASAAGWAGGAAAVVAAAVAGVLVLSMAAGPHRPAKALGSRPGVSVSASAPAGGRAGQAGGPGGRSGSSGRSGSGGSGGASPGGGALAPAAGGTAGASSPTGGPPGGPTTGPPGGGGSTSPPSQTPPASGSTPPVAPTTAPSPPQTPKPSSSPSAAPPGKHSGPCIDLLVIGICL